MTSPYTGTPTCTHGDWEQGEDVPSPRLLRSVPDALASVKLSLFTNDKVISS